MLTYPLATVLIGKILSDQEAQRHAHRALQASEEKYRLAINVTSDATVAAIIARWEEK
jgi:hypothetical protein